MRLFDAHNHLQDAWLDPHRPRVLEDLRQIPLEKAVVNGTCVADWAAVEQLAGEHRFVVPSFGLHPWNVGNASAGWQEKLSDFLSRSPDSAVGEIGLDRWILTRARADDPRLAGLRRASLEEQAAAFRWQLARAAAGNRAVTIHCVDAWGAMADTLRTSEVPVRGFLLHAYAGSIELAREFAQRGAYFSFNGYFLGERHANKREVFAQLPLDRLLVETDAPAMPPPAKYRRFELPGLADNSPINHPANLAAIYQGLAEIRRMPIDELAPQIEQNFQRLFGPKVPLNT